MSERKIALKVHDKDNVATLFANGVFRGSEVEVQDKSGRREVLRVLSDVPYGHKIAIQDISLGQLIIKYGEEIGIATRNIRAGEHVHVQNLDSMRGRGDWGKGDK